MARHYPVDRKRIYATGLSNGGCSLSPGLRSPATSSQPSLPGRWLNSYDCTSGPKVSVIAFHGTADKHVLFDGGHPQSSFDSHVRADNAVAYAMQTWRKRNACEGPDAPERKGSIIHSAWKCAEGTAVELYAVEGGGHSWPGGQKGLRFGNVDAPTTELSATDAMWEFFKGHPKP